MGQLKNSEKIFNNDFKLVESAYKISQILDSTVPQIVFFGRSNVGKSSLINAVLNRKDLAKTSKTPGRTASVNYYSNSFKNFLLVDLPGYGFNRDNKALSGSWENLMLSFLKNSNILRAFILVDSRRGLMDSDKQMLDLFENSQINSQIILTKGDKLTKKQLDLVEKDIKTLEIESEFFKSEIFITSSLKKLGIKELKKYIVKILRDENSR